MRSPTAYYLKQHVLDLRAKLEVDDLIQENGGIPVGATEQESLSKWRKLMMARSEQERRLNNLKYDAKSVERWWLRRAG